MALLFETAQSGHQYHTGHKSFEYLTREEVNKYVEERYALKKDAKRGEDILFFITVI